MEACRVNFYKRYPGDYQRDTAHLSLAEHGAYGLLLDHYYSSEKPLPADLSMLHRICRAFTKPEQKAVDSVAGMFFPVGADGLRHNARADKQIPQEQKGREAARQNGKNGGRPIQPTEPSKPDIKTETEPYQNPMGSDIKSGAEPASKTPLTPKEQEKKQEQTAIAQQAARFDEFWSVYPNRKGKAKALAKWRRDGLDAIADKIIADVKARISRDRQWLDGYIPHGVTYVNGRGWEDDIEQVKPRLAAVGGYVPLPGER